MIWLGLLLSCPWPNDQDFWSLLSPKAEIGVVRVVHQPLPNRLLLLRGESRVPIEGPSLPLLVKQFHKLVVLH